MAIKKIIPLLSLLLVSCSQEPIKSPLEFCLDEIQTRSEFDGYSYTKLYTDKYQYAYDIITISNCKTEWICGINFKKLKESDCYRYSEITEINCEKFKYEYGYLGGF